MLVGDAFGGDGRDGGLRQAVEEPVQDANAEQRRHPGVQQVACRKDGHHAHAQDEGFLPAESADDRRAHEACDKRADDEDARGESCRAQVGGVGLHAIVRHDHHERVVVDVQKQVHQGAEDKPLREYARIA